MVAWDSRGPFAGFYAAAGDTHDRLCESGGRRLETGKCRVRACVSCSHGLEGRGRNRRRIAHCKPTAAPASPISHAPRVQSIPAATLTGKLSRPVSAAVSAPAPSPCHRPRRPSHLARVVCLALSRRRVSIPRAHSFLRCPKNPLQSPKYVPIPLFLPFSFSIPSPAQGR